MNEDSFREVLREYLVPMIAGTKSGKTTESTPQHSLVAYAHPCAILMKPAKNLTYRIELVRSQPFSSDEKQLVTYFIDELASIATHADAPYFHDLMASLPRRVISKLLPGERGRNTLELVIQNFEGLASQTYEGRPVVAALGMTGSMGYGPVRLEELWKEDFSRVMSNAFDSMYVCGSDGRVFTVSYLPKPSNVEFCPHRFASIAAWCHKKQRVATVLNRNGEVLVFKDKQLQFAKRRGAWRYYAHNSVVQRLAVGNPDLRRSVYESCLDVSFARTGGCIAILTAKNADTTNKFLASGDLITDQKLVRTKLLAFTIKKPFHKLDRRLRQEILSMDGATVLKHTGEVLAAGSIVKVPGGSTGGGRRAAAMQLSGYGLAIKVSADGPMTGFRHRQQIFSL